MRRLFTQTDKNEKKTNKIYSNRFFKKLHEINAPTENTHETKQLRRKY